MQEIYRVKNYDEVKAKFPIIRKKNCLGLCCLMPLSTIFQLYRGWSVLLVKETGVPEGNHWPTLSYNVVSSTPCHEWGLNSQL